MRLHRKSEEFGNARREACPIGISREPNNYEWSIFASVIKFPVPSAGPARQRVREREGRPILRTGLDARSSVVARRRDPRKASNRGGLLDVHRQSRFAAARQNLGMFLE